MDFPTQPLLALERAVAMGFQEWRTVWLSHHRMSWLRLTPAQASQPNTADSVSPRGAGVEGGMAEDTSTPFPEELDSERGSRAASISREIVQIHRQFYGRGPTKAKTVWRDEIVVCILEEIFTKAEQLLVDHGRFEDVRSHRIAFQDEVAPLFRASVEAATGRNVKSFLSQVSEDGCASEVFVLG
jgi:uncharacterized protein YbcI